MAYKYIAIASSKGGVGKSTVAQGLALAEVNLGNKVLLCDLDFGNSCLDILCGCEDSVLYTVNDVLNEICTPESAVVSVKENNLFLLPASPGGKEIDADGEKLAEIIKKTAESVGASIIIIDTGAGVNPYCEPVFRMCDDVIVVASHSPVSLRAASSTASRISDGTDKKMHLVINAFDTYGILNKTGRMGMLEIIDNSGIMLLGIIPYDSTLELSGENPYVDFSKESNQAFENIALRLYGKSVPLFAGLKKMRKKKKILFS